jgi:hypothetical protein
MFKTVFSFVLIFCICLSAAFAKDNKTKYEEAKQKIEPDIQFYKEQSQKVLQRFKDELDAIPVEPTARKGEPLDVRKRREERAKLEKSINELEIKIVDLEKSFRSFPFFISSIDADPAIVSYAARVEERIEKYTAKQSFKINSSIRDGSASLFFFIREDGKLDRIEVRTATSKDFGEYVVKLVKELAPFEPFPTDVAAQGNMMVFNREFNFANE